LFPVLRIISVTVLIVSLSGCTPELGDSDAALLLEDVLAGESPSRLKAITPSPVRQTIEYTIDGRHNTADLYLSPQGAQAGIVLIPGVVEDGKDDLRLVTLANALARLRFAVLVPEIAGLRRFHTRASHVRVMADAFRYLVAQPELAPQGRAGFGGFSYGVGIVLLASLEPDIREKVHYLLGFGGYHDITNVVTYFTTGYYREERTGTLKYHRPHYYLKEVFTISNSDLLERTADRARVRALLENSSDDIDQVLAKLAPDARALYELVANEDPQRVATLIDKLSPRIRNELQGINPANRDLSQIKAQLILLHGRGDTMIPYTESIAIAQALPKDQVKLILIEGYAHTDVKLEREDLPQLLGAMELLMQQRVAIESME
jgi:pimeloyl-ACP methyl ester carboxylesterase